MIYIEIENRPPMIIYRHTNDDVKGWKGSQINQKCNITNYYTIYNILIRYISILKHGVPLPSLFV